MTPLHPDPPVTADERTTLVEFLDYFRAVLLRKADDLDDTQARQQIGISQMDMLGLIRHMAGVEQWWFSHAFAGSDEPEIWPSDDDPDADWHHGPADTLAVAVTAMREQITKSRAIVAATESLDQVTAIDVGPPTIPDRYGRRSLRWILVHMIEEYARHCGHADVIRENIDGAVDD
jgi:uncharacterized damage-inducible protein DinB